MDLYTIAQQAEGELASWAGIHRTLEAAQEFVKTERQNMLDEDRAESGEEQVEADALVWEQDRDNELGTWWTAYDRDGCVLYEIVRHKAQ